MSYANTNDSELKERIRARYSENRKITGASYDESLAVTCINGTFVGGKEGDTVAAVQPRHQAHHGV